MEIAQYLQRFDFDFAGGSLACWLEYEQGDKSVGYSGSAYLVHAMAEYIDVSDLLDDGIVKMIEQQAFEYFEGN